MRENNQFHKIHNKKKLFYSTQNLNRKLLPKTERKNSLDNDCVIRSTKLKKKKTNVTINAENILQNT